MRDDSPPGLDRLPPDYFSLLRDLLDIAESDQRVRAVWVGGSIARGVADAGSDLDTILAVRDEDFESFAEDSFGWVQRVTPVVLSKTIPRMRGSRYSLTPGCQRLDVVVEPVTALARTPFRDRIVVLDKDGLDAAVPARQQTGPADPEKLLGIVEEFFRLLAIFPDAVVTRGDWLLGVEGAYSLRGMLYALFVEHNQPLPASGVKQWSAKLTLEQRRALQDLDVPRANGESVIASVRTITTEFRTAAAEICGAHGVAWPAALDRATSAYLHRQLGW